MGKGASNAKALGQEQACLGTWWARWGQAGGGRDRGAPETSLIRTEGSSPRCEDINVPNLLPSNTFHPQRHPHTEPPRQMAALQGRLKSLRATGGRTVWEQRRRSTPAALLITGQIGRSWPGVGCPHPAGGQAQGGDQAEAVSGLKGEASPAPRLQAPWTLQARTVVRLQFLPVWPRRTG